MASSLYSTALAGINLIMIILFSVERSMKCSVCMLVCGSDCIDGLGWIQSGTKTGIALRLSYIRFPRLSNTEQKTLGLSSLSLIAVEHSK